MAIMKFVRPLIGIGIGDKKDKFNLSIVPGLIILLFACIWTIKLSKIALEESCWIESTYDLTGTKVDREGQRHCRTAHRYNQTPGEQFSFHPYWLANRGVENPEWILWAWAPIVFTLYVITRLFWTLLMDDQGIDFPSVLDAVKSVTVENGRFKGLDQEALIKVLGVITENFGMSSSSGALSAFLLFKTSLVIVPSCLLFLILPGMIGTNYRSLGLDVAWAWWEGENWHGSLIPTLTYCLYNYRTHGNYNTMVYQCRVDAYWLELLALLVWLMLASLIFGNFISLFSWAKWALEMKFKRSRHHWVLRNWLWLNNVDGPGQDQNVPRAQFAAEFGTGQVLLFQYIEAHTSQAVASAFCKALFRRWLGEAEPQII